MTDKKRMTDEEIDGLCQKKSKDREYSIENIKKKIDIEAEKGFILINSLNERQRQLFDEYETARAETDALIRMNLIMSFDDD